MDRLDLRPSGRDFRAALQVPDWRHQAGHPTATQVWRLHLVQTPYTTTGAHGLTLTKYRGVATLPDWDLPIEQGYVIELGNLTISLL